MSPMLISGITLFVTKRTSPKGGVMNPTSTLTNIMTQNQIGSIPSALTTGMKIDIEISKTAKLSTKQQRIRTIRFITISKTITDTVRFVAKTIRPRVAPV